MEKVEEKVEEAPKKKDARPKIAKEIQGEGETTKTEDKSQSLS